MDRHLHRHRRRRPRPHLDRQRRPVTERRNPVHIHRIIWVRHCSRRLHRERHLVQLGRGECHRQRVTTRRLHRHDHHHTTRGDLIDKYYDHHAGAYVDQHGALIHDHPNVDNDINYHIGPGGHLIYDNPRNEHIIRTTIHIHDDGTINIFNGHRSIEPRSADYLPAIRAAYDACAAILGTDTDTDNDTKPDGDADLWALRADVIDTIGAGKYRDHTANIALLRAALAARK